jgi:nucleoside-diphosphate-sugar epimerase
VIGEGSSPERPIDPAPGDICAITGATGFIGGHLAQRLRREHQPVRCLVRASSDTSLLEALEVELVVGDLENRSSVGEAVKGCRYVFHCGALVSDWATVSEIARVNVQGTQNVLEACVFSGVERLVHFSTTDIYGYSGGGAIDESYRPSRFRNWYAQTKLAAEEEVRRLASAHALDAVILRPATAYGPRSTEVVGEIARAIRSRRMILINGGRAAAGLCYIENLIDAAVLAQRHRAARGHAFNLSDGLNITWKQFTDDLADGLGCPHVRWSMPYWLADGLGFSLEHGYRFLRNLTGLSTSPLLSRQAVHVMGNNQEFSTRKARELLGWEPRVDYQTGLHATIEWLGAHRPT